VCCARMRRAIRLQDQAGWGASTVDDPHRDVLLGGVAAREAARECPPAPRPCSASRRGQTGCHCGGARTGRTPRATRHTPPPERRSWSLVVKTGASFHDRLASRLSCVGRGVHGTSTIRRAGRPGPSWAWASGGLRQGLDLSNPRRQHATSRARRDTRDGSLRDRGGSRTTTPAAAPQHVTLTLTKMPPSRTAASQGRQRRRVEHAVPHPPDEPGHRLAQLLVADTKPGGATTGETPRPRAAPARRSARPASGPLTA